MATTKLDEQFSADLEIDELRLDREWRKQPGLYDFYAHLLADAQRDHELAKVELESTRAEIELSVRTDPAAYGLPKVTESTITAAVAINPRYREAQIKTINARHAVDVLKGHVGALDHRKKALEKLAELHLANYYSAPRSSTRDAEQSSTPVRNRSRRRS